MGDANEGFDTANCEEVKEINDVDETVKEGLAEAENDFLPREDAPKLDDLSELEAPKSEEPETEESEGELEKYSINTEMIEKAVRKRAKYIKDESDKLTLAGLRRLLEKDLGLEEKSLDSFKILIRDQVDEVLEPKKEVKPSPSVKKVAMKAGKGKVAKKARSEESSSYAQSGSGEDEEEVKPKRKRDAKKVSSELKKRKRIRKTPAKRVDGNSSEDGDSRSSAEKEKPAMKKVASTPVYGKRVEHLKLVIKSCGMSVPPVLYKKVNQEPKEKRESRLIKELQEILSKEGLSANPSEKEVKEVRKKKERAKELEGIDVSNVLSSTRRRSTTSYVKPKIPIDSDGESSKEEDDNEDEEDDEENNDDVGGNDGSQSEGSNVDDEVNSD